MIQPCGFKAQAKGVYHIDSYGITRLFIGLGVGCHGQQFVNLFIRKPLQPQAFLWGKAADPHIRVHHRLVGMRGQGIGDAMPYTCALLVLAGIGSVNRVARLRLTVATLGSLLNEKDTIACLAAGKPLGITGSKSAGGLPCARDAIPAAAADQIQPRLPTTATGTGS